MRNSDNIERGSMENEKFVTCDLKFDENGRVMKENEESFLLVGGATSPMNKE